MQTKPEAELGKYKGVEIKKNRHTKVTDEDIEHELGHMQNTMQVMITVEDQTSRKWRYCNN